jgi:2-keto-4-pentenoate hydratase
MPPSGGLLIEAEIALELGQSGTEPGKARLAFEIVRSRFRRRNEIDMPSFVGDASGFHSLVIGDSFAIGEIPQLLAEGATIRRGSKNVAASLSGGELPDPIETLKRFLSLAEQFQLAVEPGMFIATGSLAVPYETDVKGAISARLGTYRAEVELR